MESNYPFFEINSYENVYFILRYGVDHLASYKCPNRWVVFNDELRYQSMFLFQGCHETTKIKAIDLQDLMNELLGCINSEYELAKDIDASELRILKRLPDYFGEMLCDASICCRDQRDKRYWKSISDKGNEKLCIVVRENILKVLGL